MVDFKELAAKMSTEQKVCIRDHHTLASLIVQAIEQASRLSDSNEYSMMALKTLNVALNYTEFSLQRLWGIPENPA